MPVRLVRFFAPDWMVRGLSLAHDTRCLGVGNRVMSSPTSPMTSWATSQPMTVLAYVSRGPMHPSNMVRTLRDNADGRSVKFTPASVYMVIQQLAKAGLVVEHETLRTGMRPERTTYALTKAGREEWHHWLRELIEDPRHE